MFCPNIFNLQSNLCSPVGLTLFRVIMMQSQDNARRTIIPTILLSHIQAPQLLPLSVSFLLNLASSLFWRISSVMNMVRSRARSHCYLNSCPFSSCRRLLTHPILIGNPLCNVLEHQPIQMHFSTMALIWSQNHPLHDFAILFLLPYSSANRNTRLFRFSYVTALFPIPSTGLFVLIAAYL